MTDPTSDPRLTPDAGSDTPPATKPTPATPIMTEPTSDAPIMAEPPWMFQSRPSQPTPPRHSSVSTGCSASRIWCC